MSPFTFYLKKEVWCCFKPITATKDSRVFSSNLWFSHRIQIGQNANNEKGQNTEKTDIKSCRIRVNTKVTKYKNEQITNLTKCKNTYYSSDKIQ